MKVKLIFSLLVLISAFAHAQTDTPGWNYPSDPDLRSKTDEKIVLYTDNMKLGNMRVSANHLSWLLQNTPDLNESIYINGAKIYEALVDEAAAEAAIPLQDSALMMYDLRITHFGDEANVLNRKGYVAYKYLKDRKDRYPDLFALLAKVVEINGNDTYDNNLIAYMDAARRHKLTGGDLSDEQVFEIYSQISDILDYKLKTDPGNSARIEKISENVDKILTATVDVNCQFVEEKLAPKMRANPDDLKTAKLVFKLLLTGKCSDSPAFIESAEIIHASERTFGLASVIAKKYSGQKDYEKAEKYYNEALSLTEENTKKAEVYLDLAKMYAVRGMKSSARTQAQKAAQTDPSSKAEAYTLIGNLYMGSYEECKKGVSRVEDRGVFLAAYDAYQAAGDSRGMASAQAQFPAIDEIFSENKKEGDSMSVGCWINTTTTIRRRPAN